MRLSTRKIILSALSAFSLFTTGYVYAQQGFDIRGIKFGMEPSEVKIALAKIGPVSSTTLIDFFYQNDNNKVAEVAGYKFCVVKQGSCAETYVVAFTEVTQVSYHITRVVTGTQMAPLKTIATQLAQKYGIAKLDEFVFDDSPYWVLYFVQPLLGSGQLVPGQDSNCGAFGYGNGSFDRSSLNIPHRSSSSCPEVAGAIQFTRNGAVHDLADSVDIMATNHKLLNASLIEKTKLRLQRQQNSREAVRSNRLDL